MYDTILVPHAGTSSGDLALKHAIHIAKSNSSKILILHIVEDFPHAPTMFIHSSQASKVKREISKIIKDVKTTMEKKMIKHVETCKKNGIESDLKIVVGLPAEEILKVVKNKKIDLIVIAKRRKLKGVKKLLSLGSVSRKVVENVTCPVMLLDIENL